MSSQLVNLNLGYGNKAINEAIKEQVDKYCFVGPSLGVESRAKLAKKIVDLMPDNMGKVFFTNAGADAMKMQSRLLECILVEIKSLAVTEVIMVLHLVQVI